MVRCRKRNVGAENKEKIKKSRTVIEVKCNCENNIVREASSRNKHIDIPLLRINTSDQ